MGSFVILEEYPHAGCSDVGSNPNLMKKGMQRCGELGHQNKAGCKRSYTSSRRDVARQAAGSKGEEDLPRWRQVREDGARRLPPSPPATTSGRYHYRKKTHP